MENPIVTPPENKFKDDDVKFILRAKKILEKTGEESQSESVVCELLWKIESMEMTIETLEATMIGRTVNALKKHHASDEVRKIAATLVKQWKSTALKEWNNKQSNIVEPTEVMNKMMKNMEIRNKVEGNSEKVSMSGSGGVLDVMMDSSKKPGATKRKRLQQQQGFDHHLQELENFMKKQRIEDERERSRISIHNKRMFVLLPPGLDPALLLVN